MVLLFKATSLFIFTLPIFWRP